MRRQTFQVEHWTPAFRAKGGSVNTSRHPFCKALKPLQLAIVYCHIRRNERAEYSNARWKRLWKFIIYVGDISRYSIDGADFFKLDTKGIMG